MPDTTVINSLLVTLEPDEDAEDVKEELEDRDDVVRVSILKVEGQVEETVDE
ncbi:hypothetical protein DNAM5_72 [Haloarcula californiae tailed virus 1]|uniref:Uncharacterized protein n=1 Tax=Haloarcula californiae tailed virus 1 TaxID=1273746 RepID=R4TNY8_9CAUD|nr:hypothetical protein M202_gp145 [Haloarcula californiae tailed virus 1]AGM11933.1 hypothetical protein DNAM5_72 [Haloarcula californiae tailed virus 1]